MGAAVQEGFGTKQITTVAAAQDTQAAASRSKQFARSGGPQ